MKSYLDKMMEFADNILSREPANHLWTFDKNTQLRMLTELKRRYEVLS